MSIPSIHPGQHLAEELEILGMSAADLAHNLDVPTNRITQILNGQRAVSGDTALRLAHFFGTNPEFWLKLQNLYELRLAQMKAGGAIRKLPILKRSCPTPQKKYALRKLLKGITPENVHGEVDFGDPQGREFPRGARRTR